MLVWCAEDTDCFNWLNSVYLIQKNVGTQKVTINIYLFILNNLKKNKKLKLLKLFFFYIAFIVKSNIDEVYIAPREDANWFKVSSSFILFFSINNNFMILHKSWNLSSPVESVTSDVSVC